MTSGTFRSMPIASITITRDTRQRRELAGLDDLAESIRTVGLIHPPVVSADNVLIAGERRLTACRDILGWTSIPVQIAEEMPHEQLHLIELEENVKRLDLTWQEECNAVAEYHALRGSLEPEEWTVAKTAEALGLSPTVAHRKLDVAEALAAHDPMVVKADKFSVAANVVLRKKERQRAAEDDKFTSMLNTQRPAASTETSAAEEETPDEASTRPAPFLNIDFSEWANSYSGPKFNFLHCDFPYGVNANKHNQGASGVFGGYDDSEDVYFSLLDTMHGTLDNFCGASAHMMFWFSMDFYTETKSRLEKMGWTVNPFPLIWHKNDNSGILPDPKRGPRRIYETAFLCSRGDRPVVQPVANVFSAPNVKNIHMSEKNPIMLQHFFRMFVDQYSRVLDPTMGSGNAVVVAQNMGAEFALGIERDEEFFTRAVEAYTAREEQLPML